MTLQLATEIDWQSQQFLLPVERIKLVDRLGFDYVFSAEANGSDALTPLGFVLGITSNVGVGTRIAQIAARTAPALAMGFQTLKAMSNGRPVIAGVGNSGVEQVEAWHGQRWGKPYYRMRDYVDIMHKVAAGGVVSHQGSEISIPYADPDGQGTEQPLAPLLKTDPDVPVMMAAGTETMIRLAAQHADGWMPTGFAPGMMKVYGPMLEEGFRRAGDGRSLADFPIWTHADLVVDADVKAAMLPFKQYVARWGGGWSPSGKQLNVFKNSMVWRGYGEAQARIEELWQAGRHDEAVAAVPDDFIDEGWLIGPLPRIVERWKKYWLDCGATGLVIRSHNLDVYEPLYRAARG